MGFLELKVLTKAYKRGGSTFNAVDHASLSVEPGDFISITGKSGSGKSTLLNMIAGLIKPTGGTVFFEDQDIYLMNDKAISFFRNEYIGYVLQGPSLLSNFTVWENLCIPWFLGKRGRIPEEHVRGLLEKTGISHLADSYPKELSGGEMRRAAIARGLINNPRLLIADEPTSNLDGETKGNIMALFSALAQERTAVLLVTHEIDTLFSSSKTYSMEKGRLTLLSKPDAGGGF